MAAILPFARPGPTEVEAAWESYRALAARVVDNPALLINREHVQAVALAERRFRDAFLASSPETAERG